MSSGCLIRRAHLGLTKLDSTISAESGGVNSAQVPPFVAFGLWKFRHPGRGNQQRRADYSKWPSSANGPLGCGRPPAGSVVTAAAFNGTTFSGTRISALADPSVSVLNTLALTGFPALGTNQSW